MNISIIKGTTNKFALTITDADGKPYALQNGDKIIFGVKLNSESSDYLLVKRLTKADVTDGACMISLVPEDTAALTHGRYFCDIGLQTADGDYYMVVPCCEFYINRAITQKE